MVVARELTIDALNTVRDSATTAFADQFPYIAGDSDFAQWADGLRTYSPMQLEFINTLIGKIGLTLMSSKLYQNKLAPFKTGELLTASDVEEIFVEMISGVEFDPDGLNVLARSKPNNIHVLYHRQNRETTYPLTISDKQTRQAFRSLSAMGEFLGKQVQAMYSGAAQEEYVAMKELMAKYASIPTFDESGVIVPGVTANGYYVYDVPVISDTTTAKNFVKTVKKAVRDISYVNTLYNAAGVKSWCQSGEAVLFLNKDIGVEQEVEVLATAFNRGDVETKVTQVEVDDFGSLADTYGLLVDKDFFRIFDTLQNMESIRNPKGMFTNFYLNIQQTLSLSKFKCAVQFKATTPSPS